MKNKTGKPHNETFLKSLKIHKDFHKNKLSKKNEKKIYITILETLTGVCGLAVATSLSITRTGSSVSVPIAGGTSFLSSVATLITNEYL